MSYTRESTWYFIIILSFFEVGNSMHSGGSIPPAWKDVDQDPQHRSQAELDEITSVIVVAEAAKHTVNASPPSLGSGTL